MRILKLGCAYSPLLVRRILPVFVCVVLGTSSVMSSVAIAQVPTGAAPNKTAQTKPQALSLSQALSLAINNDPWLTRSKLRQQAILDSSEAVDTLPNPVLSFGLANLPTDGFAHDQEPMTQLKAGVSQQFGRGQSLAIQRKQMQELAQQHPLLRQDRMAKTKVAVSSLWLDVYRAQQIVSLIENDRALFEQLADIVQASYSSAVGKVRQQDIVRAQLELARLEDRLNKLMSQKEQAGGKLLEWLNNGNEWALAANHFAQHKRVSNAQPAFLSLPKEIVNLLRSGDQASLAQVLSEHPAILAIAYRINASESAVELAKQASQPQWGVNASYAYRADDPFGRSRADFLSLGISVDLPFFTQGAQDKKVSAAVQEAEAIKTDKLLAIRTLLSQLQTTWSRYQRLQQRQQLFNESILMQTRDQAEASLTAYTNDDGSFSEVVRARIDNLNARIDVLNIQVDLLKAQAELNYFFAAKQQDTEATQRAQKAGK